MLHWALTAMSVNPADQALSMSLSVDGLKFKCPTCRTYTSARFDAGRDETLRTRYPEEYEEREAEAATTAAEAQAGDDGVHTMTLMTGNSHRKVPPSISPHTGMARTHEFTFFIQSSRPDLIDTVEVILHPTFRENRLVTLREPPFTTTHLAWGYFIVYAGVTLKRGWEWVGEERAVDSNKEGGRCGDRLPMEWGLDFGGAGSQKSRLVKYREVTRDGSGKGKEEVEGEGEAKAEKNEVGNEDEDEDLDLGVLAELMSASEIAELREVRRLKRVREREQAAGTP